MDELTEHYMALQNECGIQIGDKVKVLRNARDYEMGWNCNWVSEMNSFIGEIGMVQDIGSEGITVKFHSDVFLFPFFVLENKGTFNITVKLNDAYNAVVSNKNVVVGCQQFTHESILKLADAVNKMNKKK